LDKLFDFRRINQVFDLINIFKKFSSYLYIIVSLFQIGLALFFPKSALEEHSFPEVITVSKGQFPCTRVINLACNIRRDDHPVGAEYPISAIISSTTTNQHTWQPKGMSISE
jgi:hypothetical protein